MKLQLLLRVTPLIALVCGTGLASGALAQETGAVFTYEADVARVATGWKNRVFLVVADGGPCRVPIDRVARDPSALYRKRRVGCAIYLGDRRLLLTTASVVRSNREVEVFMEGGQHALARIVGVDPSLDVALLETIEDLPHTEHLSDLELAPDAGIGSECLVLGNAYGRSFSAVMGTIGDGVEIMHFGIPVRLMRVNAAFFPGDSGGAVLDGQGRFVGMITAISHPDKPGFGPADGALSTDVAPGPIAGTVGFALPASSAHRAWHDLLEYGRVRRGYLGVSISLTREPDAGARILLVHPGSPAERAGLRPGDLVTGYGRSTISSPRELRALVAISAPGERLDLQYSRGRMERFTTVEIGESTESTLAATPAPGWGSPLVQEPLPLSPTTPTPVSSPR
jgi:S1-C subfamily serine protease